jgi:hypothetical protein
VNVSKSDFAKTLEARHIVKAHVKPNAFRYLDVKWEEDMQKELGAVRVYRWDLDAETALKKVA